MAIPPRKKKTEGKIKSSRSARTTHRAETNDRTPAVRTPRKKAPVTRAPKTIKLPEALEKPAIVPLSAAKVRLPPVPQTELPENYGDNQIYLLVRDPHWIYSYWEIQKDHQDEVLKKIGGSWDGVTSILRVFDVTDGSMNPPYFDIVLQHAVRSWYINVQPNHAYVVEIGLLHRDGRYASLARSNTVRTPRSGMSEVIDEQWMSVDWDKMYALSGGFQVGKSSAELRKLMEERLKGAISSGSGAGLVSSMASPVKIKKRGFFFWLECELIIYGGTEPDATVTMQGRTVKLRPDGTFTLRYALPDGKFTFDCHAHSSDGVEEREITPVIGRSTKRPAPIIKRDFKK
ncbi:MAG TPA: DUF4912 domain-containing protein [Candidatus Omnitrophota bacterium]|jgi:hypothetical protein|nr:DUF4912 domain-containing protein [Candidatus Omnitrophota bacterium]